MKMWKFFYVYSVLKYKKCVCKSYITEEIEMEFSITKLNTRVCISLFILFYTLVTGERV